MGRQPERVEPGIQMPGCVVPQFVPDNKTHLGVAVGLDKRGSQKHIACTKQPPRKCIEDPEGPWSMCKARYIRRFSVRLRSPPCGKASRACCGRSRRGRRHLTAETWRIPGVSSHSFR
jgi:hypothetical protein